MHALDVVILIVAVLVLLTFVWGMRSGREAPRQPSRRAGLNRRRKERDLP